TEAKRMFNYLQGRQTCDGVHIDAGSGNYSWNWGRLHLVMLNTWAGDTFVHHTAQGLQWLANDLNTFVGSSGNPIIIFQHYGFSSGSYDPRDGWTGDDINFFLRVIRNYNILGIFSGHTHTPAVVRLDASDWATGLPTKENQGW